MLELARVARKHAMPLWHEMTVKSIMRSLVFSVAEVPGVLRSVVTDQFDQGFAQWMPLLAPDLVPARMWNSLIVNV